MSKFIIRRSLFCITELWTSVHVHSFRPDRIVQFVENWASIPKLAGSNHSVARQKFFSLRSVVCTQSSVTILHETVTISRP